MKNFFITSGPGFVTSVTAANQHRHFSAAGSWFGGLSVMNQSKTRIMS